MSEEEEKTIEELKEEFEGSQSIDRDDMKKNLKVISNPEAIKVGMEKNREKILELLKINDMTISQISEALGRDQSTIYRHVRKLEEAGFVEICGERREHHIPERVYGRTADFYLLAPDSMQADIPENAGVHWNEENAEMTIRNLCNLGIDCEDLDGTVEKTVNVFKNLHKDFSNFVQEKKDEELYHVDFFGILRMKLLYLLIEMENDPDFCERIEEITSNFDYINEE